MTCVIKAAFGCRSRLGLTGLYCWARIVGKVGEVTTIVMGVAFLLTNMGSMYYPIIECLISLCPKIFLNY